MRALAFVVCAAVCAAVLASSPAAVTAMPIYALLPGWGRDGHDVTAALAQRLLTPAATRRVLALLPQVNGQLVDVANWADEVKAKPEYRWSAPLHFINTPDWACTYERARDCVLDGVKNFCVDGAIQNYTQRVVDGALGADQQSEALKFLVHFVGDIHQPLHVAFTTDKGGNSITGKFEGRSTNLHAVWDTAIIAKRLKDDFANNQTAWTESLAARINGTWSGDAAGWVKCKDSNPVGACSQDWAEESIEDACTYAYVAADGRTHITTPFTLGDDYYTRNLPVVEMQLAKAGVRMAHVLNSLFPGDEEW